MRYERHGGEPDLQAAFRELVLKHLHGRALDDNQDREASEGKFPDFSCFNDLVLIEMKHLATSQHDRVNSVLEKGIDPTERPLFFGSREAHLITEGLSNSQAVKFAVASKLSGTVETILRKANTQFADYRTRNPRKNSVNICVILNSTIREYSPSVVGYALQQKAGVKRAAAPRFPFIDAVIYISEKHFQSLPDGRTAFALLLFQMIGTLHHPWKAQFIDRLASAWSYVRTGSATERSGDIGSFETVEDIPKSMKRHELWSLEYQRSPYLSQLTTEQLRGTFNRVLAEFSLSLIKGSWPVPSKENRLESSRKFQHVIEETNRRGVDLRLMDQRLLSPAERAQTYAGLPTELIHKLTGKGS